MSKTIATENAPAAIGPYVQGVDLGNMIITSGQIPVNPKTGEVPADVAAQARQSLDNVKAIVEAAGLKVGDIVVSDEARYHDADVTAFGYEYGQLPGCPAGFKADDKLIAAAEACIAELNLNAVRGLIVSGDAFINGSVGLAKIRHNFPQAIAVEMEATAIAHVCHNFNVPFVVVRAISDVADQQSHLSFDEFLAVAAKQSSLMVESLVQKLAHG